MEPRDEAKLAEQITIYENKIKAIKDKIGDELRTRRDLKEKVKEAKKREATQILILERLDEYQKIVNQQIEAVAKMEDNESVKQLAMIEKYEIMLREQQELWTKYKAEYEDLPLAKERRESELRLLKVTIQNKLICKKIEETKRILKMKAQIGRRIAQLRIIEFAKLYVEHKKKEISCSKLKNKVKSLKFQEKELKSEVERLEKQAVEQKRRESVITKSSMMLSQQLPKVDLSAYIISRDKREDALDNQSINSYKLEQEYVNSDIYMNQDSSQSNDEMMGNHSGDKETQALLNDSMDIDDDEYQHQEQQRHLQSNPLSEPTRVQKFQRTVDRRMNLGNHESGRKIVENKQPESNSRKSNREKAKGNDERQDQSRKAERSSEHDRRTNFKNASSNEEKNVQSNAMSGQHHRTRNLEHSNEHERRVHFKNAFKGEEKEVQQQKTRNSEQVNENDKRTSSNSAKNSQESQPDTSHVRDGSSSKRRANTSKQQSKDDEQPHINRSNPSERPIPTPAKMAKHTSEQQQQQSHSQSPKGQRNQEQFNFNRDLSKLPQSNKPHIKSVECVNYQNVQPQNQTVKPFIRAMPASPMESLLDVSARSAKVEQQQQDQPQLYKSVSMELEQAMFSSSPISSMNNMLNMETPSMISDMVDMNNDANSDISMILGSEITEPGGSMELAKRFYEDSDANSEDGFNYEKMIQKFCSPVPAHPRQEQHQEADIVQPKNQEQRDQSFSINTQTVKKPTNASQRFF